MIRIETTAEFDADGRFTPQGQLPVPVTPGQHRGVIELDEPAGECDSNESTSPVRKVGNEDPEAVRQRLDNESVKQAWQGPFE